MKKKGKIERAVALVYNEGQQEAPRITASGAGPVARRILQTAEQAGIHITKDPDLVELLAHVPVGREIPPELYQTIAEVLAYVYQVNDRFKHKMDSQQSGGSS